MFGSEAVADSKCGVIPRACREALEAIKHPSRKDITADMGISYVEIYGELVTDLLQNGSRVGQSKVASQSYVLSGAAEHPVTCLEDLYRALVTGDAQKRRAATAMNDRSSRAHSLIILSLRQQNTKTGVEISSRLFLADLGGSEQVSKSKVEAGASKLGLQENFSVGFQKADAMRETVNINLGLLALKKCVENLNNQSSYVPYQDSKLTMLLSAGLGGNSKTSIILTCSMLPVHASETVSSLRFGERCALVENESRSNANMLAGVLAELDAKIAALEAQIKIKEKWVVHDEVRVDALAEANTLEAAIGGKEVKKVSVLTGAEAERKELEILLIRRAKFTGSDDFEAASYGSSTGESSGSHRRPAVVAFGSSSHYGLGAAYDASTDAMTENDRFKLSVENNALPTVVRLKGAKQWTKPEDLDEAPEKLQERARKVKRNKLVYSGISA